MAGNNVDELAILKARLLNYQVAASAATDPIAHRLLLDLIAETERLIAEASSKGDK